MPTSAGGPDSVWNLAAACRRCNFTRGVTPAEEFALLAKPFTVDKRSEEEARNSDLNWVSITETTVTTTTIIQL